MKYVAAFRTYTWSDGVAELARRFFRACPSAHQVVLADETRGPLGIPDYEVISHTKDTRYLGLLDHPKENSLWFNVDYGAYILRHYLPYFDYYVLSESDLAVNLALDPVVQAVAARGIDIVAHNVRKSPPDWAWHRNGKAVFEDPWQSILFFMILSGGAIDTLLSARRRHAVEFREGRLADWPFCEPFVPSVLKEAGARFADLSEFADTVDLKFRPRIMLEDERASRPGSLVHSVLQRTEYVDAVLREFTPREWLRPGSPLRAALKDLPPSEYGERLLRRLETLADHAALVEFKRQMAVLKMTFPESEDIAYCKPSATSSTSEWSRHPDPQQDAAGANGFHLYDDFAFHTDQQLNPWWMVDLVDEFLVDEIHIINRKHNPERFASFMVESSLDGQSWLSRHIKVDFAGVSADPERPHEIMFSDPFVARYVRVVALGITVLHLRRVRMFGRGPLPARRSVRR